MKISPQYAYATPFYEDGFGVCQEVSGKFVIIDTNGNKVLTSDLSIDAIMHK